MNEYQRIANARTTIHDRTNRRTKQVLKDRDLIGIIAEGEFSKLISIETNTDLLPGGDGGFDFKTVTGATIDIKATERPKGRLFVKNERNHPFADVYVLAVVNKYFYFANFIGFLYKDEVLRLPVEEYHGAQFYACTQDKLRAIWQLWR